MSRKHRYAPDPEAVRLESKYSAYNTNEEGKDIVVNNARGTVFRFFGLLKPQAFSVAIVLAASIGGTIVNVTYPTFLADIIDSLQEQIEAFAEHGTPVAFGSFTETGSLFNQLLRLGLLFFLFGFSIFVQQFVGAGVTQKLVFKLRNDVNKKLSVLPLSYFDRTTKGETISRVVNDIENVAANLQDNFITVLTGILQIFGSLFMMLKTGNYIMTLVAVVLVPFSGTIAYKISRISKRWFKRYWASMGALNGHVEEMYTGHTLVHIFNHEKRSIEEFKIINNNLRHNSFVANMIAGILGPILTVVKNINYVSLCIVGGCFFIGKWFNTGIATSMTMGLGSIEAFLTYSSQFSSPITNISKIINNIQSALASAERVFSLLDEEEQIPDKEDSVTEPVQRGHVEFKDVSFRYLPDKPLIDHFDLTADPGQLIAIVGPTGAGKTTLVNLLMRFYEVDSGQILIDGIDTKTMSRDALRSNFGMVLQDTWLFKGTIRENISYGTSDADDEAIQYAAKCANIHDFIMTLPNGYDFELTEEGANLSQGQRQLVTIARALLRDPKILILDEATSSVDTKTEAIIQQAMEALMRGRTSFVIAHRLSTIKNADNIIVMNKGTIVEQGTHKQLMADDGFYASLYKSQYTGGIPEDAGFVS